MGNNHTGWLFVEQRHGTINIVLESIIVKIIPSMPSVERFYCTATNRQPNYYSNQLWIKTVHWDEYCLFINVKHQQWKAILWKCNVCTYISFKRFVEDCIKPAMLTVVTHTVMLSIKTTSIDLSCTCFNKNTAALFILCYTMLYLNLPFHSQLINFLKYIL